MIALARSAGAKIDAPLGVMTFEPHPRQSVAYTHMRLATIDSVFRLVVAFCVKGIHIFTNIRFMCMG